MPYLLNNEKTIKEMLAAIGVSCFEELYEDVPAHLKISPDDLSFPDAYPEEELKRHLKTIASRNRPGNDFNSFLGAGCYKIYIPSALKYILNFPEFLTSYTPYQPECSQGILQALYEFQTFICLLTGMEVANASLLDGASSLAEAIFMSLRITQRKKVLISRTLSPLKLEVIYTYLSGIEGIEKEEISFNEQGQVDLEKLESLLDSDCACFVFSYPNFFGLIEEVEEISRIVKRSSALLIVDASPLALSLLKEPAKFGADIVCGEGQVLGGNLNLGGEMLGFMATLKQYIRQMPGRIIARTQDKEGKTAYCLTLQAREQHIRRFQATSNICTNNSLLAIKAAVYLSLLGKEGLRAAASSELALSHYLYDKLKEIERIEFPFLKPFFNEFVIRLKSARDIFKKLYQKKIIPGLLLENFYPELKDCLLIHCSHTKKEEHLLSFIEELKKVIQ